MATVLATATPPPLPPPHHALILARSGRGERLQEVHRALRIMEALNPTLRLRTPEAHPVELRHFRHDHTRPFRVSFAVHADYGASHGRGARLLPLQG